MEIKLQTNTHQTDHQEAERLRRRWRRRSDRHVRGPEGPQGLDYTMLQSIMVTVTLFGHHINVIIMDCHCMQQFSVLGPKIVTVLTVTLASVSVTNIA